MKRKIPSELRVVSFLFVFGMAEFSRAVLASTFQSWFPTVSIGLSVNLASIPGILIGGIVVLLVFMYWEKSGR